MGRDFLYNHDSISLANGSVDILTNPITFNNYFQGYMIHFFFSLNNTQQQKCEKKGWSGKKESQERKI